MNKVQLKFNKVNKMENQSITGVTVLAYDFSKAFDQLDHRTILHHLSLNSFPEGFVRWTASYLHGRTQRVKLNGHLSSPLPVLSGVPQGSLLGPFLFNLVVGSLHAVDKQHNQIVKYVDDCTFVIPIGPNTLNACIIEHENMVRWSDSVGLRINPRKCKALWIPKSANAVIPTIPDFDIVNELRILGVVFTPDLKWNAHLRQTNKIVSKRLFGLRILRPIFDHASLVKVYNGLILSIIEYCSPLLIGMSKQNETQLTRLQRRAHRLICGPDCSCSCLEDLAVRRERAAVELLLKISNNPSHPLNCLCPSRSSRSNRLLQPPACTVRRRKSFFPTAVILLNKAFVD